MSLFCKGGSQLAIFLFWGKISSIYFELFFLIFVCFCFISVINTSLSLLTYCFNDSESDYICMWCYLEDFLNISAHIKRFKNTITFVKDKILDVIKLEAFFECQIKNTSQCTYHNMGTIVFSMSWLVLIFTPAQSTTFFTLTRYLESRSYS